MKITKNELKEIIREEIKKMNEDRPENGLMVYPSTRQDKAKIEKWLDSSDYYAEWDNKGYFWFPEKKVLYNQLENELGKIFNKLKINVRFDGV
jgi:hypothetical protein